jgi:hypothetical protein
VPSTDLTALEPDSDTASRSGVGASSAARSSREVRAHGSDVPDPDASSSSSVCDASGLCQGNRGALSSSSGFCQGNSAIVGHLVSICSDAIIPVHPRSRCRDPAHEPGSLSQEGAGRR